MFFLIQLFGYRLIYFCRICKFLIVISCNRYIQRIVRTLLFIVCIYIFRQNIACFIFCTDTCINIYAIKCITDNTQCQICLYVCMLADRSAVTFCNSSYRVIICIVSESRYFIIF